MNRILFMGTPDFAVTALKALVDAYGDGCQFTVVTMPDKPVGRHHTLQAPPVKQYAESVGIPVYQPESMKEEVFGNILKTIDPDCIIVAAFGRILPPYILEYPRYHCVNIHASLLPVYRGASPIHTAVINGETESGITIMKMAEGLDTGDIILQESIALSEDETTGTLHDRLAILGGEMIVKYVSLAPKGEFSFTPQDDSRSSYAAKIDFDARRISFSRPARSVLSQIRGLQPVPGAICFSKQSGKQLKIMEATVTDRDVVNMEAGSVLVDKKEVLVACEDRYIALKRLQEEGGKPIDTAACINGRKLVTGDILVPRKD